jgi:hypothetical protein
MWSPWSSAAVQWKRDASHQQAEQEISGTAYIKQTRDLVAGRCRPYATRWLLHSPLGVSAAAAAAAVVAQLGLQALGTAAKLRYPAA